MQTLIAISLSVDIWAISNWQDIEACIATPHEAISTRCGGEGVLTVFGWAKPVNAPECAGAATLAHICTARFIDGFGSSALHASSGSPRNSTDEGRARCASSLATGFFTREAASFSQANRNSIN
jgi:hypothetical protein